MTITAPPATSEPHPVGKPDTEPERFAPAVLAVAAAFAVVVTIVGNRHGFHRDELYFLATARHLDWGYVDQPPLTAALPWLATNLFGAEPWALRIPAHVAGSTTVVLSALTARELGGRRNAQLLAAGCTALSGAVLTTGWMFATVSFDIMLWAAIVWLVARLVRTTDTRLWLPMGVLVGVALLNKHLVGLLVVGLLVGLIAGDRRTLRVRWLPAGVLVAVIIALPNLVWQAHHGWPVFEMTASLREENGSAVARIEIVLEQLLVHNPALAPVWIAGLVWLLGRRGGGRWRAIGVAFLVVLGLLVLVGGKGYYAAGLLPALFAAGAVRLTDPSRSTPWFARRPGPVILAAAALPVLLVTLPVLPPSALASPLIQEMNEELAETVGWPELVAQVAAVHGGLPADERNRTVVMTLTCGEAGAIDRYGPALGLPPAFSGHNSYWWWGPPAGDGPVIVVGYEPARLERWFSDCRVEDRVRPPHDLDTKATDLPVSVCAGPLRAWAEIWPEIRHYG